MRKRTSLILAVALLGSLLTFAPADASHSDAFTFLIPWTLDELAQFFDAGSQTGPGGGGQDLVVNGIEYTISVSVLRGGSVIYYDHGEDGLEPNATDPVQASTGVWGDGDPSNGAPPGDADDVLANGQVLALQNEVPLSRTPSDLFFDGGDRLVSVGGALAVTMAGWPISNPTSGILFADAFELFPTSRWGTEYVVPIGQDVSRPNRPPFSRPALAGGFGFGIVALSVQALDDGTQVEVRNPDGTVLRSATLNAGAALIVPDGVLAGMRVVVTNLNPEDYPVQVHVFAKDPISWYQARGYTLLPLQRWSNEYLGPRSSDGDFWFYNPNGSDLDVTMETFGGGSTTVTVPPGSTVGYPAFPDPVLAAPSGVRFFAPDPFYVVAALDQNQTQDWGYAVLPTNAMSAQALVGWAPNYDFRYTGVITPAGQIAMRVYVTALNATTIHVDYDSDGVADPADDVPVQRLEEVFILDPSDDDMTGARLFTDGEPFLSVWGQDASAPVAQPSMDVGASIVPLRAPSVQKAVDLITLGYNCGPEPVQVQRVRFELQVFNDSSAPIQQVVVLDELDPGLAYVANSTFLRGNPIADDTSGSPFPFDGPGRAIGALDGLGDPEGDDKAVITYEAIGTAAGTFSNRVGLVPEADPAVIEVTLDDARAGYQVSKTLVDPASGPVDPGQVITFNVTITNTGSITIPQLPLRDEFRPLYLTFRSASVMPDVQATNVLTWTDLIPQLSPGGLPPNSPPLNFTLSFTVNDPLPPADSTLNRVLSQGVPGDDGPQPIAECARAVVSFGTPTPTRTLTPTHTPTTVTRTRTREHDCEDCDGTVTVTRTPTTPPPPPPTVTPAVQFLPETGVNGSPAFPVGLVLALPVLGLALILALRRRQDE